MHLYVLQDIKATVLRTLAAIVHLDRNPKYDVLFYFFYSYVS